MTSPTRTPEELLGAARAQQPKIDPRRRERVKSAVFAGVAGSTLAASGASAAMSWWTGVAGKVVIGLSATVVGSGLTYGVVSAVKARSTNRPAPSSFSPARVPVVFEPPRPASPAVEVPPTGAPPPTAPVVFETHRPASPPAVEAPPTVAPPPTAPVVIAERKVDLRPSPPVDRAVAPLSAHLDQTPTPEIAPPPLARPSSRPVVTEPTREALDEELALLQRAMSLHEAQDERGSAEVLAQYATRFPKGVMRIEALTLRVLVECALGRTDEASELRHLLEREAPHVLVTPRLQQSCAK